MRWDRFTHKMTITEARVVATLSLDGGAIVESGDIEFVEGRTVTVFADGDTDQVALGYYCEFGRPGAPAPDAGEAVEAFIVIDGQTGLGPTEIRGTGFIGYDDRGNLEGRFDEPPAVLLDEAPPSDDAVKEEPVADWVEHMKGRHPKLSPQYVRAMRARSSLGIDD